MQRLVLCRVFASFTSSLPPPPPPTTKSQNSNQTCFCARSSGFLNAQLLWDVSNTAATQPAEAPHIWQHESKEPWYATGVTSTLGGAPAGGRKSTPASKLQLPEKSRVDPVAVQSAPSNWKGGVLPTINASRRAVTAAAGRSRTTARTLFPVVPGRRRGGATMAAASAFPLGRGRWLVCRLS
jgi:hypothetical protein